NSKLSINPSSSSSSSKNTALRVDQAVDRVFSDADVETVAAARSCCAYLSTFLVRCENPVFKGNWCYEHRNELAHEAHAVASITDQENSKKGKDSETEDDVKLISSPRVRKPAEDDDLEAEEVEVTPLSEFPIIALPENLPVRPRIGGKEPRKKH